jgi:hypothetical protein
MSTESFTYPNLDPPKPTPHPEGEPLPEHFAYAGLPESPKPPNNQARDENGLPQYFSYRDLDGTRQKGTEPPAEATTATPDDERQAGGSKVPPPAESQPEAAETGEWESALDRGEYQAVGKSIVQELASLGASSSEIGTAHNLCQLAEERQDDPAWRQWSRDMIRWVRSLRTAQ